MLQPTRNKIIKERPKERKKERDSHARCLVQTASFPAARPKKKRLRGEKKKSAQSATPESGWPFICFCFVFSAQRKQNYRTLMTT